MKIESKIKREGGSKILMGRTQYHFAPLPDGAHVAVVDDEAHQDRFLSITEGFRLYRGAEVAAPVAALAPAIPDPVAAPEIALGSDTHPATFDINGKTYQLGDVVELARAASGLDVAEWNELAAETRADLIDDELDKLQGDTNGDGVVDAGEERAALAAQYQAKFGKAPHHKAGIEKIRAALAEG